jgi:hypothetical protein
MSFNQKGRGKERRDTSQQRTISKFFAPVLAPCNKKPVERKKVCPVVAEHYDCFSGVYVNSKNNTWYYKNADGEKSAVDNHPFFCEKRKKVLFCNNSGQLVDMEDEPVKVHDAHDAVQAGHYEANEPNEPNEANEPNEPNEANEPNEPNEANEPNEPNEANEPNDVHHRFRMRFKEKDIDEEGIYTGKPRRIYRNAISDSYKVDILWGDKLHICKKKKSENTEVYAHFKLVGTGEHMDCSCGACDSVWSFSEDECKCEA